MEQIRELYDKLMNKGEFKKKLAKVLFMKSSHSVGNCLKKNHSFKEEHIEKVKECLKMQLEIDEQLKNIEVEKWQLVK